MHLVAVAACHAQAYSCLPCRLVCGAASLEPGPGLALLPSAALMACFMWRGSMLRSRISRRVIAEQHIHLAQRRPGFIGVIATDFSLREAVEHAAQRTQQARAQCPGFGFRARD